MGKQKDNLFNQYKKLMKAAGIYSPHLDIAIRAAARTESMLNELYDEQDKRPFIELSQNTKGDPVEKESPLLVHIAKYENLHLAQLRAIGLNYDTNPQKVKEAATNRDDEDDPLVSLLNSRKK